MANDSYRQTLNGVVQNDDIEPLLHIVEQHKNWGAFSCKLPSYIIVNLIDALKTMRDHGKEYYETAE
jgi:hypothetical protein